MRNFAFVICTRAMRGKRLRTTANCVKNAPKPTRKKRTHTEGEIETPKKYIFVVVIVIVGSVTYTQAAHSLWRDRVKWVDIVNPLDDLTYFHAYTQPQNRIQYWLCGMWQTNRKSQTFKKRSLHYTHSTDDHDWQYVFEKITHEMKATKKRTERKISYEQQRTQLNCMNSNTKIKHSQQQNTSKHSNRDRASGRQEAFYIYTHKKRILLCKRNENRRKRKKSNSNEFNLK